MEKLFINIYTFFEKKRWLFWTVLAGSFAITGFLAAQLKLEEDISKILPKDKKIDKLNEVFQHSKFLDKLVITISLKDTNSIAAPDSLIAYSDALVTSLQTQLHPYINKIQDRVDDELAFEMFSSIYEHLPVYLDDKDYQHIDTLTDPVTIQQTLEKNIRTLSSPAGLALKSMIAKDPVGISFLGLKKLQQLQYDDNFELYDSHILTKSHQQLLIFIEPAFPPNNTGKNAQLLRGLDNTIDSLSTTGYPNIRVSYFGATAVSESNAAQLRKDSLFTQGVTIVFLILFIGLYFKKKRAPFIILLPVAFGALFSLAMIYLLKGEISVIALGTGSVVLGIAVNYSLHIFNHYKHTHSIQQVINDLTMPLTVGSFTTIGGFLCLEFVKSEMLKDLGLFAAFSLIGASLCSLIFLPHLMVSSKENLETTTPKHSWIDKIASWHLEKNKLVLLLIVLLTIVFTYTANNVSFQTDMMRMNFMSEKLKKADSSLNKINAYSLQSVYLISSGKDLDEALQRNEKATATLDQLKQQGLVKKYSGVTSLIISKQLQQQRINRWNQYWTPQKKLSLINSLRNNGQLLKYNPRAFDTFNELINKKFEPVNSVSVAAIRKNFLNDFITETPGKATVITLVKISQQNRPLLYNAFDSNSETTVIDKQYLTGRFIEIINSDFTSIALMSSILVFVVLLITYGRIELALVSFIPMFISWIWILGIMGILGIQFNIVNIIISALIFGLGDDYSLFIMDGLLQEYKTGKKNLSSYKSSIILSAITTIAGLGVLIFAKHPALQSIAVIAIVGILCVVIIGQILIPFLFNFLIRNRTDKKRFPWTFTNLLKSLFAFAYFVFGAILLTIIGFLLLKLNPFARERAKTIYHSVLSYFSRSLIYIMVNVKKRIYNPIQEDFRKPAVIVCNHQSFLDILLCIMLHPKLILFTNNWVWNSPVFGAVVRMADYYPVSHGAEESIDKIRERVEKGYSVVVFAEGTRSADGQMKRFHKGAFYLAEHLQLDILPIIIHGTGYTMGKNDFLLKDGKITVKILPRIQPSDMQFGSGYAERTKKISRYFKQEYEVLRYETEQPSYFKEQLFYNYLYKGPVLEWYMRIKVRMEHYYQLFDDLCPKNGTVLDIGCGYGFMAYTLHFREPGRQITGIDYDDQKIATANHCFNKDASINFVCTDVLAYPMGTYTAIILSDVLHYLQPAQQKTVVEKCIRHLEPGGTIIIRDGNKDLAERHKGTELTETFSTRVFGFNKTSGKGLSFLSGALIRDIASAHQMSCTELDNTRYTSNIIFVIKNQVNITA